MIPFQRAIFICGTTAMHLKNHVNRESTTQFIAGTYENRAFQTHPGRNRRRKLKKNIAIRDYEEEETGRMRPSTNIKVDLDILKVSLNRFSL